MARKRDSNDAEIIHLSSEETESTGAGRSAFADSAVDIDATATLSLSDSISSTDDAQVHSPSPEPQSLAERIRRIASTAWTLEQEDIIPDSKRLRVEEHLNMLETIIHTGTVPGAVATHVDRPSKQNAEVEAEREVDDEFVEEMEFYQVHDDLSEVIGSMRLRQQEQRHLHQLTASKLEAVAQRCIFQEQQMRDLMRELRNLRVENQTLGQENDKLRDTIVGLESTASKQEVAVSAMASAVAGLEGWIDEADRVRVDHLQSATPPRGKRQRRAVVRGKGRFRGRHYVDDDANLYNLEQADARDLQDGVRAWIRGFRDVEDACSSPLVGLAKERYGPSLNIDEDEWGEYESAAHGVAS